MRYLDRLDLSDRKQFAELSKGNNFTIDNQFLKKDSLVLPGSAIFTILFEGTKGNKLYLAIIIIV
jgi:hypothetical protein